MFYNEINKVSEGGSRPNRVSCSVDRLAYISILMINKSASYGCVR